MDITSVFTLCGGIAFFLFGMHILSQSLETLAGGRLEAALRKLTSSRAAGLCAGAGITAAVQSSSAVTVMLVGLADSGIVLPEQTVGVIMGSNIGTTFTAWLLGMSGIKSDNFFLSLLTPESFAPIIALVGTALLMVCKSERRRNIGLSMLGFSVLMYGMEFMKNAMAPLARSGIFQRMLTSCGNPVVGVVFGAVFTGVIQSSSASVGMLQALSMTGTVTFREAVPIIMGQNIGTCATALLSSIGVGSGAKRVAVIHTAFNIIGTAFCMAAFYVLDLFLDSGFTDSAVSPVGIAAVHSVFNIMTTMLLYPFSKPLVGLSRRIVPD